LQVKKVQHYGKQQDGVAAQGSCASGVDAGRLQRFSVSYDMDSNDKGL
jgi:hypothetical protein